MKFTLFILFLLCTNSNAFDYLKTGNHCDKSMDKLTLDHVLKESPNFQSPNELKDEYKKYMARLNDDNCRVLKLSDMFKKYNFPKVCKSGENKVLCLQRVHDEIMKKNSFNISAIIIMMALQSHTVYKFDYNKEGSSKKDIAVAKSLSLARAALLAIKHVKVRKDFSFFFKKNELLADSKMSKELLQYYEIKENKSKSFPSNDLINFSVYQIKMAELAERMTAQQFINTTSEKIITLFEKVSKYKKLKKKDEILVSLFLKSFKEKEKESKNKIKALTQMNKRLGLN
tara:strand:- start:145912 stop:146769 length:858 start_codon:yes stop_codon:yes gene_type:complete